MQWQIDLLSRLSDLSSPLFTLSLSLSFRHHHPPFLSAFKEPVFGVFHPSSNKVHLCVDLRKKKKLGSKSARGFWQLSVSCSLFSTLHVPDCPPLERETLNHFTFSTFVSVSVARGEEYWTLFISVVAESPRRAMADNSWSDWLCCLSVKSA